jgi:hypothetical protein
MTQLSLFDDPEPVASALVVASCQEAPGRCYICHFEQRSGPPMWKLGYTEASPYQRARQIACVLVTWWPGSKVDERRMHKRWKHRRVSRVSEFFYHGPEIDPWVWEKTCETPGGAAVQLAILDDINRRCGYAAA